MGWRAGGEDDRTPVAIHQQEAEQHEDAEMQLDRAVAGLDVKGDQRRVGERQPDAKDRGSATGEPAGRAHGDDV